MLKKLQRLIDGLPAPLRFLAAPLRWLFGIVRRADVVLLEGKERATGLPLSVAYSGPDDMREYLSRKAFQGEPAVRRLARTFIWLAPLRARQLAADADLMLVYAPPLLDGLVGGGTLARVPPWVRMDVDMADDDGDKQSKLGRSRSKAVKGGYTTRIASDDASMREFVDRLHLPFVKARHGETAHAPDEPELAAGLRSGKWELLLVEREGTALAGVSLDYSAPVARFRQIGVRDASPELLAERISDVCYAYMLDRVKAQGAPTLDLGSCRSFLSDGVVEYKRLYGGYVSARQDRATGVLHFKALRLGPGGAAFLSANAFVARDTAGRDHVCAFVPKWDEAAAKRVDELKRRYCAKGTLGLEVFLLEGEPPLGLELPGVVLRPVSQDASRLDWPSRVARKLGQGPAAAAGAALKRLLKRWRNRRHNRQEEEFRKGFDERYGVDTLRNNEENALYKSVDTGKYLWYDPTKPETFFEVLKVLPEDLSKFTFVDVGSGKGRALLLATEKPFQRIVGVEMMKPMHEIAEANVRTFREKTGRGGNIDLLCADALSFPLPEGPTVYYLFNTFDGDVMKSFVERIDADLAARPRPAYVVYVNPRFRSILDGAPGLALLAHGQDKDGHGYTEFVVYERRSQPS